MGKAVSSIFGMSRGDAGGLGQASDDAHAAFQDASNDYQAQNANRLAFGNQLAAQAAGTAPSIANAQMNAGLDKTLAQQLAAAKSARAVNPALAFRSMQNAGEQAAMQTTQNAGIARLQEQQANQGQYQNYLSGLQNQRAQFLGINTQAAGGIANANAQEAASQNAFAGGLLSAGAGAMASMASGGKSGATPSGTMSTGSAFNPATYAAHGALIKAPEIVPGDSTTNDIVSAQLSGGEMVVPKSVVEQGHKAVGSFAKALLEHNKTKPTVKPKSGFAAAIANKKG